MMHENSQALSQTAWETTAATNHECKSPASVDMIAKVGKGLDAQVDGWDGAVAEGLCPHQGHVLSKLQLNSQQTRLGQLHSAGC